MKTKKSVAILILLLIAGSFAIDLNAKTSQENGEITLITSADGSTKEEAIKIALRNAIEQVYGTFVSANTEILNDEMVKEEIITISSGNIKRYEEISTTILLNNKYFVQIQATVCLPQLIEYAKSKGSEIEFAGASFTMNLKMKEMNKRNEEITFCSLIQEMQKLLRNGFDYDMQMKNPTADGEIVANIFASLNETGKNAFKLLECTMASLTLSETECAEYSSLEIPTYPLHLQRPSEDLELPTIEFEFDPMKSKIVGNIVKPKFNDFVFRSVKTIDMLTEFFLHTYVETMLNFSIVAGNESSAIKLASFKTCFDRLYSRVGVFPVKDRLQSVNFLVRHFLERIEGNEYKLMGEGFLLFLAEKGPLNYIQSASVKRSCYMQHYKLEKEYTLCEYWNSKEENMKHEILVTMKIPIQNLAKISKIIIQPLN